MSLTYNSDHLSWSSLDLFTIISFLCLLCAILYIANALFFSPWSHIPGPILCKLTRLWVAYHDLRLQRNEKIYEWHQKYGPVVMVAPGQVSFSSPTATREIYGSALRHPKSSYFDNFQMYGERSIFCTLDWAEHREMRKRTFAFYQRSSINRPVVQQPLRARTIRFLNDIDAELITDSTLEVFSRCNLLAFDNVTGLIYGPRHASRSMEMDCQERRILAGWKLCEVWNNLLYNLPLVHRVYRWSMSYINKDPEFLAAEELLADWNSARIASAVQQDQSTDDRDDSLLQRLHTAKTASGDLIPSSWIKAEILDNIHAAQTTVALALSYAMWNLATHPQWQDVLREELRQLPVEEDGLPSFASIEGARVLGACIRESYRVNSLSSGRAERVVPVTKAYEGVVLPQGVSLTANMNCFL
jgi:cytochrome P450